MSVKGCFPFQFKFNHKEIIELVRVLTETGGTNGFVSGYKYSSA